MKQVLQNLRTGETLVEEVPSPHVGPGSVLIRTRSSLISAGSERMIVEFGKASLIAKARSQPDKVKKVIDKIKTDGLMPTLEAVFSKLDEPMPLGYCNAGAVLEVGHGVSDLAPGDRVMSNGPHAEVVCVPRNLCAKIPDGVSDEQAAFTVLASVALQGIRLLTPALGERFVVYGLGLAGLLAVQLLRAQGCEVLGVDINADRLELAEGLGVRTVNSRIASPVTVTEAWTEGMGADGVLVTAAAKTDEIMHQSAEMCRKRGRIVLVGVVGLHLRRSDFYKKEITFQVSCSYGPGRYDEGYEQGGQDFPHGFVRWTENRNFQAVLSALANGTLKVDPLIGRRYPLTQASEAYETVGSDPSVLGVLLEYPAESELAVAPAVEVAPRKAAGAGEAVVGVIGAGKYSAMMLMPCLSKARAQIAYVADLNGAAAKHLAKKYRAEQAVSDYKLVLEDPRVDAVLIAMRHSQHARLICEVLAAGKHVFTEKPLAMDEQELEEVRQALAAAGDRLLMVGFNRRFSRHVVKMKELLAGRGEPMCMNMTINAGHIPPEHWVHDPAQGGGRIIGEGCHFIDLMVHLTGSLVRTVSATMAGEGVAVRQDKMAICLGFEDGSVGTINYFANGIKSYPKEMLEVFSDRRVLRLENFRRLVGHGFKAFKTYKSRRQDKGHAAEFSAFVDRVASGGESLIAFHELDNVTRASFAAVASARESRTIEL